MTSIAWVTPQVTPLHEPPSKERQAFFEAWDARDSARLQALFAKHPHLTWSGLIKYRGPEARAWLNKYFPGLR